MRALPVVMGEMTVRGLLRRRAAMAIFVLLPLLLYVVRHEQVGQSIRMLLFGVSWGVTTVAYFAAVAARDTEPRLRLAGWSWRQLVGGRVLGLLGLSLVLTGGYLLVVLVDQTVADPAAVAVDFVVTAVVSVAFGTALGSVLHRDLDGALAIFLVAALQSVVNPDTVVAHLIPFWSSREIGTYAIDGPDMASLVAGLAHAAVVVAASAVVALVASRRRLEVGGGPARSRTTVPALDPR